MLTYAQDPQDSVAKKVTDTLPPVPVDTSINYDLLFNEMESFLDSILSPHSYTQAALTIAPSFFNYKSKESFDLTATKKIIISPAFGYYHKGGLGITAVASFLSDQNNFTFYQFAATPSYDYLKNKDLATGISYTRYFTKDSLPFYTSPLQNEVSGYFIYRRWWFKPMVAVSYGWGSHSEYQEREEYITTLQLRRRGYTRINTKESIADFSVITSVRHDFYWLNVFSWKDHIRLTPQLSYTSGSQKFGFNQSSNTYTTVPRTNTTVLYSTENIYLDDKVYFQPVSLTFFLRTEYSIGKFYIQPQLVLDYYFPAEKNKFSSLLTFNTGFIF